MHREIKWRLTPPPRPPAAHAADIKPHRFPHPPAEAWIGTATEKLPGRHTVIARYDVDQRPDGRWDVWYDPEDSSDTVRLGEFATLEQAKQRCEDHWAVAPAPDQDYQIDCDPDHGPPCPDDHCPKRRTPAR